MSTERLIAQKLLQIKAIKLNPQNPFTWASGIKSPIYCDNRVSLSFPEVRNFIKKSFGDASTRFGEFDMIAGVATAGIAHGVLLADLLNKPFCYVRSAPKGHGRQNLIEGEIPEKSRIIVIEDLISTGGSSIEVVEILRKEGHFVSGVLAIFDYGFEKAKENFGNIDCKYFTLSNYHALLTEAIESRYISDSEAAILAEWNKDPQAWYEKHF